MTQSDSAGSTSHRGQSLISTIALLASARYFALIGRRHGELGRVVRKLQLVRCERGSKARRAAVASSWLFKWRQPTVVRQSCDGRATLMRDESRSATVAAPAAPPSSDAIIGRVVAATRRR